MSYAKEHKNNDKKEPLFKNLTADEPEQESTIIESLCMNCGKNVSFI